MIVLLYLSITLAITTAVPQKTEITDEELANIREPTGLDLK
jgi:hypothetical protein